MHYDISQPNQYILFQDTNNDIDDLGYIVYDDGEEIGNPIIIDPRFTMVDICGTSMGGSRNCVNDVENDGADASGFPNFVSVAFARPDFDAVMHGDGIGRLSSAEIIFSAGEGPSDITRTVLITNSGQITVE